MHRIDANNFEEVDSARFIEVGVGGPGDANRLLLYTGTAIVRFSNVGSSELESATTLNLQVKLRDGFTPPGHFIRSATFMSLAVVQSVGEDNNDECLFRTSDAESLIASDGALVAQATLTVGSDSTLIRVAYSATILAHLA
jgi:hypothetical protein